MAKRTAPEASVLLDAVNAVLSSEPARHPLVDACVDRHVARQPRAACSPLWAHVSASSQGTRNPRRGHRGSPREGANGCALGFSHVARILGFLPARPANVDVHGHDGVGR